MVDVPRQGVARRKMIRRILFSTVTLAVVAGVTYALMQLEPAAPSVDRDSVWIGSVTRGEMVIAVRGPGTLVPEEIRWVAATVSGRVEKVNVLPGTVVARDTVLIELANPELERQMLNAQLSLERAEAELEELKVSVERDMLAQEAAAAQVKASMETARLQDDVNQQLVREGLLSPIQARVSAVNAAELENRYKIEEERLAKNRQTAQSRIAAKEADVRSLQGQYELNQDQVHRLKVRAGIAGVLQQRDVEVGHQVTIGQLLGKVAVPGKLKAELRIPETQAKDVKLGQVADIDTRNGHIEGRVIRIDPAATEASVTVDVALLGQLPPGARPELNVDGTITIDRLDDTLQMGRPAYGQADSLIGIFKLINEGAEAVRTQVRLGRSSVTVMQVLEGLNEGDEVILSDTANWDNFDKIRLVD